MFADFWWQTPWMLANKGRWGHPGGLAHAGLHAGMSLLLMLTFGVALSLALLGAVFECAVHYHIDWAKARYSLAKGHTCEEDGYWRAVGLDQLAHHLTYLAMLVAVAA